jgi:hypothetical protein
MKRNVKLVPQHGPHEGGGHGDDRKGGHADELALLEEKALSSPEMPERADGVADEQREVTHHSHRSQYRAIKRPSDAHFNRVYDHNLWKNKDVPGRLWR